MSKLPSATAKQTMQSSAQPLPSPKPGKASSVKMRGFILSYGILLLLFALFLWFVLRLAGGVNLEGVEGRAAEQANAPLGQNLLLRLHSTLKREAEMSLSEQEINRYLNEQLELSQEGLFGSVFQVEGVYLDLRPGEAFLILERSWLGGSQHTMAVNLGYEKVRGSRLYEPAKGSWDGVFVGKQGMPAGMVILMMPALESLYSALAEEIELLEQMRDVRIEEGKIIVSARKTE